MDLDFDTEGLLSAIYLGAQYYFGTLNNLGLLNEAPPIVSSKEKAAFDP